MKNLDVILPAVDLGQHLRGPVVKFDVDLRFSDGRVQFHESEAVGAIADERLH